VSAQRPPELAVIASLPSDVAKATFTPERLAEVRRAVFADGIVSPIGIDLLFATLAVHGDNGPHGWSELVVDALATYVVDQVEPVGHVSEANANWLIGRLSEDHKVFRRTEFAALVAVMARARSVPDRLAAYTLRILSDSIIDGEGVLVGPGRKPGCVTDADVVALRQVLYAAASEGFGFVTRGEAEQLFAIARAAGDTPHAPAFDDLFARAVGNHLLADRSHLVPSAAEALRRERWLDERQSLAGGLGRLFSRVLTCVISGDGFVNGAGGWLAQGAADTILGISGGVISPNEARWLESQIATCAPGNPSVAALMAFIAEEPGEVRAALGKVA
jgi:hypothetical protein